MKLSLIQDVQKTMNRSEMVPGPLDLNNELKNLFVDGPRRVTDPLYELCSENYDYDISTL